MRIALDVTTDGAAFNEHGSCLLASGTEPFLDGGYEIRSADFQSPDSHFGTTLFRLEANDDGTCSFRHLNTGFLLGKKSDNTSTTLDVVQNTIYAGQ